MEDPATLEALRLQLAPAIADAAVFDGWSKEAVLQAADMTGVDRELAAFAFRDGPMAMITAWVHHVDAQMAQAEPAETLKTLSIRERIRRLVMARLDAMWRRAGDTATDYNHYTKRAILAGIYAATLNVFARDASENKAETRAFLDRRIEGIIRFEKTKAQFIRKPEERFSMTRLLGRIRYPAR